MYPNTRIINRTNSQVTNEKENTVRRLPINTEKYKLQSTGAIRKKKSTGVQTDIISTSTVVDQPKEVIELIEDIELSDDEHCLKFSNGMVMNIKVQAEKEDMNDSRRSFTFYAECPICIHPIGNQPISSTICGHVFCTGCIISSFKASCACPICKKFLMARDIHPLFLPVESVGLK